MPPSHLMTRRGTIAPLTSTRAPPRPRHARHQPGRGPPSTVMTATDIALEQFLDDTRDQRLERYLEFLRIPSISTLPDHADDVPHRRRMARRAARGDRRRERRRRGNGRPPDRHRRLAPRRRARRPRSSTATTTSSRSIRSTSGSRRRSRRRQGRSGPGPRLVRRQGPDHDPPARRSRRCSRPAAAARSTSGSCSRARRRAAASTSTRGSRPTAIACAATSRHLGHQLLRRQPAGDHDRRCAA